MPSFPQESTRNFEFRNALAFLDMLAWAEGTGNHPAMDGYDVIVTGIDRKPEVFKDFSDHPFGRGRKSKVINSKGLTSNASGRYHQMLKDWPHYRALPDVNAGRIETAIKKCRGIWASLLGVGYGQREHRLEDLIKQFRLAGGTLS